MKYLSPVHRPPAQSLVGQVYRQIKQESGVIADPFRLHAPVPELLAGIWSVTREIGTARQVPWPVKEAVAAAVSQSNACPYCVEIHAAVAAVRVDQPLALLLTQGRTADITDPSLRAVVTWARATRSPEPDLGPAGCDGSARGRAGCRNPGAAGRCGAPPDRCRGHACVSRAAGD